MKKVIYITAFTILGVLLQFFIHIVVEIFYINLLIIDFETYGLGLSWSTWFTIHIIGAFTLFTIGTVLGFQQGKYWWKKLYVDRGRA